MPNKQKPQEAGHRRSSMRDVAKLAQVAMSSVSRVLSNHADVSAGTRSRVLRAVRKLDYEPDPIGQSLRRGTTRAIGYVVGDISNPLQATIIAGAESALRHAGYSLLLMNSENDPRLDAAHIRFLASRRVDGMILSLSAERWGKTISALNQLRSPIVFVDREVRTKRRMSVVRNDHRSGIRSAVSHLLDLGHRRIVLITGPEELWPARERAAGMAEAIASRGIRDETATVFGSWSAEHGDTATRKVIGVTQSPTALIAGGNQILSGCLRALSRARLRIPTDMSVITCDGSALSDLHSPPIASVERDVFALGHEAATLLLRNLRTEGEGDVVTLPTRYVARASCGPPHDLIVRALHPARVPNSKRGRHTT